MATTPAVLATEATVDARVDATVDADSVALDDRLGVSGGGGPGVEGDLQAGMIDGADRSDAGPVSSGRLVSTSVPVGGGWVVDAVRSPEVRVNRHDGTPLGLHPRTPTSPRSAA